MTFSWILVVICLLLSANVSNSTILSSESNDLDDYGYGYEYDDEAGVEEEVFVPPRQFTSPDKIVPLGDLSPLVSDSDDIALNRTRELFLCRPNPIKASVRTVIREQKKVESETYVDTFMKGIDSQTKEEMSDIQKKIRKLTVKRDRFVKKVTEESPRVRQQVSSHLAIKETTNAEGESELNATSTSYNATADYERINATLHNETLLKAMTFRERLELKARLRQVDWILRQGSILTAQLGLDCEGVLCVACKVLVEEFAVAAHGAAGQEQTPSLNFLFRSNFCRSRNVTLKYQPYVQFLCESYFLNNTLGYGQLMLNEFSQVPDWNKLKIPSGISVIKQSVCRGIGACEAENFVMKTAPTNHVDDLWDTNCFVCQAFGRQLEENIAVMNPKYIIDSMLTAQITSVCDSLELSRAQDKICRSIYSADYRMRDLLWMARVLGESIVNRINGDKPFPDTLCQEFEYCEMWEEEAVTDMKTVQKEIENVYN